jgi:[NiFe] hydrogenase assembly HybE family chaperone
MSSSSDAKRTGFESDPSPVLERVFARILAEDVSDMPLLNPALRVEAVGFARDELGWLGVLVTPWFMNLMLLPAAGVPWQALATGAKRRLRFPAGEFVFFGGWEEQLGEYLYCSMFSPMAQFADHESAWATAAEIRPLLYRAADAGTGAAPAIGTGSAQPAPQSPSKRAFLRGRMVR